MQAHLPQLLPCVKSKPLPRVANFLSRLLRPEVAEIAGTVEREERQRVGVVEQCHFGIIRRVVVCTDQLNDALADVLRCAGVGDDALGQFSAGGGVREMLDADVGLGDEPFETVKERGKLHRERRSRIEAQDPLPRVQRVVLVGAHERLRQIVQTAMQTQHAIDERRL